jgi:hypothetical protein
MTAMTQRFLVGLTAINLGLLLFLLSSRAEPALGASRDTVLRGSALEIVDGRGRVRASIRIHAAEAGRPDGRDYPETVMLRLIDAAGRPEVKIGASERGGALSLVGEADGTQALLLADTAGSSLRLKNQSGEERRIQP